LRSAVSAPTPHRRGETKTVHRSDNAATTGWRPVSQPHSRNTARRDTNGDWGPAYGWLILACGAGVRALFKTETCEDFLYFPHFTVNFWMNVVLIHSVNSFRFLLPLEGPGVLYFFLTTSCSPTLQARCRPSSMRRRLSRVSSLSRTTRLG